MARCVSTEILVRPARDLSRADYDAWSRLQCSSPAYDSPFFCPEFALALDAARRDVEVAVVCDDEPICFFPFQRRGDVARPLAAPACDFQGPLLRRGAQLDPADLLQACQLSAWHFTDLVDHNSQFKPYIWSRDSAPRIDLPDGFDHYHQARRRAGSEVIARTLQKQRKLQREIGGLRFEFDSRDPAVLSQLLEWKQRQCQVQGYAQLFTFPWMQRLLDEVLRYRTPQFSGHLATMHAADQLQAAFLCLRSHHVLHVWVIAYRAELSRYSPGYQLLTWLIEQAPQRGIRRIDLGRGDERFKTEFATSASYVARGSIDLRPVHRRCGRAWFQFRRLAAPWSRAFQLPWNYAKRLRDHYLYQ